MARKLDVMDWPGVQTIAERQWVYVERREHEDSVNIYTKMAALLRATAPEARPLSGGVLDEAFVIRTPSGEEYRGFSFRGDLNRWAQFVTSFAALDGRQTATITEHSLVTSGGQRHLLNECVGEAS